MSTTALETLPRSLPCPPPATTALTREHADGRPNQSVRCGLRVLRVLHDLGPYEDHQVAAIAEAAKLRTPHVSRLLAAAVAERVAERGARHGSYRLTHAARELLNVRTTGPASIQIRQVLEQLHAETRLAVTYHQPGWRLGAGLHLDLVDAVCPPDAELHQAIARQHQDLRHSAAGRAALTFLPAGMNTDANGQLIELPHPVREMVHSSRVAASRTATSHALATCILRAGTAVAILTVLGPSAAFSDPLHVQEYAVLLRRAAQQSSTPAPTTTPRPFPAGTKAVPVAA
ncbi:hypothetical protein ACH41H_24510 [Streptomyces sp. NPDC020800]|uniref:hypothetical protein n=1 Tax=Streptomyces sp. NPDC020800 TaxID=3365092 RepID=UPI0037A751C0